ncbi:MAG: hypothetical protein GXY76_18140 [Chloroflexi bacterium]|nr:hypothetical protein [Chloroflexota bacterium]
MANDILWEVYAGATPAWTNVSGRRMVFGGSPKNIDVPVVVGEWQRGVHLGTTDPGIDTCGKNHLPAPRFVTASTYDGGSGQEHLNDTNLAATECTLRVHVTRDLVNGLKGARLFIYDGLNTQTRAEGLKVYAFQRGVSGSAWTLINDGLAGIGGDNPGERLDLADSAPAADHYYYIALSVQLQRYDVLPTFNIGFQFDTSYIEQSIAASADDATELNSTTAVDLDELNLRLNYENVLGAYSTIGLRWQDVHIPATATIKSAKVLFNSSAAYTEPATVTIRGEKSVTPAAFQAVNGNISGRTPTTASVSWPFTNWGADGTWEETPDIAAIIQEIIGLPGWTHASSDLALIIQSGGANTNRRAGKSYDNAAHLPPRLYAEWTSYAGTSSHIRGFLNFCTGDPEYEIWLLDNQQERRFLIDELPSGFHWEKASQGWGSFSDLKVNMASPAYPWLRALDKLLIRRGRHDLMAALIEKPQSDLPQEGEAGATYTVLGRSLNALLERRRCVPLPGEGYLQYTGHPDDAAKYMVQYNLTDTYAERPDDTGRAEPGFSVQPARSECPEDAVAANRTVKYTHEQTVGDACADLASRYGIDYEVKADGEGRLDFETYYPWRGVNRAEGNPEGNRQVILTVDRENLVGISAYTDRLKVYNVIYVLGVNQGAGRLVVICKDEASIATYGRREGVLSMGSTVDQGVLTQKGQTMLAINGHPVEGVTFTFRQTEALKYGRDFDVGDYVSVYFEPFQLNLAENWRVKRVAGTLVERAEQPGQIIEELEITLGQDEPDLLNDQAGGGGGSNVGPIISTENPTTIQPDDSPYAGDPSDPHFPELASILHVHGISTNAPYDTGGKLTNQEDMYASDNPGSADMEFVRRSHQHALFDTTTPEDIAATGNDRANESDYHAAFRSHVHKCARYSHTHSIASSGAHTHTTDEHTGHEHSLQLSGWHTHSANHCHNASASGVTSTDSGHYHTISWSMGSGNIVIDEQLGTLNFQHHDEYHTTVSAGAHTHTIASSGAHTHTTGTPS